MATLAATPTRSLSIPAHWRARIGYLALLGVLAYLVVLPMIRLQSLAFENGAQGYRSQYGRYDIAETLWTTLALAVGSLVIAMVLGTLLAFAASRLPAKLGFLRVIPILPIVMPAIANIVGWAFLLSPGPGYLNVLLRKLPWWSGSDTGPIDVYTVPWIILLTAFGLTSFVYLFVGAGMQNISSEHLEAAQVGGSSTLGVFFRIVLPLLRPSLIYGGGIALLLGLGQFTGPLLLGQNSGVKVLTTEMYHRASESPSDFAAAAAAGSPLVIFGLAVVLIQKFLLGNQARFVTHGGKAFAPSTGRAGVGHGDHLDLCLVRAGHPGRRVGHRLADAVLVGVAVLESADPRQLPRVGHNRRDRRIGHHQCADIARRGGDLRSDRISHGQSARARRPALQVSGPDR